MAGADGASGEISSGAPSAVRFSFKPAATGGAGGGGGGANAGATGGGADWARRALAVAVPSALHTGQMSVNGMRPPTGSTSNLIF